MKRLALLCILFARGALAQFDATEMCFASAADMVPLSTAGGCAAWTEMSVAIADDQFWSRSGTTLTPTTTTDNVTIPGGGLFTVNSTGSSTGDLVVQGDTATSLLVVDASADAVHVGDTTQGDLLKLEPTQTVFNEDGSDRDFRVEGDPQTNAIYMDGATGYTVLNGTTPFAGISQLTSNGHAALIGSGVQLFYNTPTVDDANRPGVYIDDNDSFVVQGDDHGQQTFNYFAGLLGTRTYDAQFVVWGSGTGFTQFLRFTHSGLASEITSAEGPIFLDAPAGSSVATNQNLIDIDFNARGDNDTNMLYADASADRVGVGVAAPDARLHVDGRADEIQLIVQAHSTQTSNVFVAETSAGTDRLVLTGDGRLYGSALHNNSGAVTGATNQYLASGTWTPTLTGVTNIAASTARLSSWTRVGNVVTMGGQLDADPTAAGATELGISLPIASALSTAFQCGGSGAASGVAGLSVAIDADATNDRARMRWVAVDITNQPIMFTITCEVL